MQSDQFSLSLRLIDMLDPVAGRIGWPIGKPDGGAWSEAVPQARPSPIVGSTDQARAKRIPLDVSADREKMLVVGDGEGLETALVKGADAQRMLGMMPHLVALRAGVLSPRHMKASEIRFRPHFSPGFNAALEGLCREPRCRFSRGQRTSRALRSSGNH